MVPSFFCNSDLFFIKPIINDRTVTSLKGTENLDVYSPYTESKNPRICIGLTPPFFKSLLQVNVSI